MSTLLIQNGRLIDPANNTDKQADLFIKNGRIAALPDVTNELTPDKTIDASGLIVCPGLIDLCARLRIPGTDSAEQLEQELRAAAAGGITRLVCPPDTRPVIDLPAGALLEQDLANSLKLTQVHPLGAATVGLEGERLTDMAMLKEAGCIGVSNGLSPIRDTLVARRAMQYAATYDITVFLTPFDPYLQGNGCLHEGEISTLLGLPAIPEAAETVAVARDLALIETTGVRAHFQFLSSARSVEMVREAQQRGIKITASVAAHHLHLSENDVGDFDSNYKVIPPLRSEADRIALQQGIADKTITTICSDHQSRGRDAKLAPFSEAATGIVGLQTLLPLALLVAQNGICSLSDALSLLTSQAADLIGVESNLAEGSHAELCLFDPDSEWLLTDQSLLSRGKNTPFLGRTMLGKVRYTIRNGEVIYSAD